MSVFNIFMLKCLWNLRAVCVAEHLRTRKVDNKLRTKVYVKITDRQSYLH